MDPCPLSPAALREIAQVEAEIDRIESANARTPVCLHQTIKSSRSSYWARRCCTTKHLSVNRNEACAFCHMPQTGFTGPVSELKRHNRRLPRIRAHALQRPASHRPTATHRSLLSCISIRRAATFVGGNFWGHGAPPGRRPRKTPQPRQAQGPFINPVENGPFRTLPVPSIGPPSGPYRALFEDIWGPQGFRSHVAW